MKPGAILGDEGEKRPLVRCHRLITADAGCKPLHLVGGDNGSHLRGFRVLAVSFSHSLIETRCALSRVEDARGHAAEEAADMDRGVIQPCLSAKRLVPRRCGDA
jgi:hypothetical protein